MLVIYHFKILSFQYQLDINTINTKSLNHAHIKNASPNLDIDFGNVISENMVENLVTLLGMSNNELKIKMDDIKSHMHQFLIEINDARNIRDENIKRGIDDIQKLNHEVLKLGKMGMERLIKVTDIDELKKTADVFSHYINNVSEQKYHQLNHAIDLHNEIFSMDVKSILDAIKHLIESYIKINGSKEQNVTWLCRSCDETIDQANRIVECAETTTEKHEAPNLGEDGPILTKENIQEPADIIDNSSDLGSKPITAPDGLQPETLSFFDEGTQHSKIDYIRINIFVCINHYPDLVKNVSRAVSSSILPDSRISEPLTKLNTKLTTLLDSILDNKQYWDQYIEFRYAEWFFFNKKQNGYEFFNHCLISINTFYAQFLQKKPSLYDVQIMYKKVANLEHFIDLAALTFKSQTERALFLIDYLSSHKNDSLRISENVFKLENCFYAIRQYKISHSRLSSIFLEQFFSNSHHLSSSVLSPANVFSHVVMGNSDYILNKFINKLCLSISESKLGLDYFKTLSSSIRLAYFPQKTTSIILSKLTHFALCESNKFSSLEFIPAFSELIRQDTNSLEKLMKEPLFEQPHFNTYSKDTITREFHLELERKEYGRLDQASILICILNSIIQDLESLSDSSSLSYESLYEELRHFIKATSTSQWLLLLSIKITPHTPSFSNFFQFSKDDIYKHIIRQDVLDTEQTNDISHLMSLNAAKDHSPFLFLHPFFRSTPRYLKEIGDRWGDMFWVYFNHLLKTDMALTTAGTDQTPLFIKLTKYCRELLIALNPGALGTPEKVAIDFYNKVLSQLILSVSRSGQSFDLERVLKQSIKQMTRLITVIKEIKPNIEQSLDHHFQEIKETSIAIVIGENQADPNFISEVSDEIFFDICRNCARNSLTEAFELYAEIKQKLIPRFISDSEANQQCITLFVKHANHKKEFVQKNGIILLNDQEPGFEHIRKAFHNVLIKHLKLGKKEKHIDGFRQFLSEFDITVEAALYNDHFLYRRYAY